MYYVDIVCCHFGQFSLKTDINLKGQPGKIKILYKKCIEMIKALLDVLIHM